MQKNGTMMQYFEWYLQKGVLWQQMAEEAPLLCADGITALWIPPAYKGAGGEDDTGYGVYDLYDLGEFDQKGGIPTKYGTKEQLLEAIQAARGCGLQIYADIVLDHMMGADGTEEVVACEVNPDNRWEDDGCDRTISAWTHFSFPGRNKKYSDVEWHWQDFTGIDYDEKTGQNAIFLFRGKEWERVDKEHGTFDYLMGANLDLDSPEVVDRLKKWGQWFVDTTGTDGFRIDAVKHMRFSFYSDWLHSLRTAEGEELFAVGEYWNGDLPTLKNYLGEVQGALSLFDVPLHFRFFDASSSGSNYDMRTIFNDTLTADSPTKSVTFVDNHDTQPGQSLQSWVQPWFRPIAYALILLREAGYPCVFYGDYYGIPHDGIVPMREELRPLLKARELHAYGRQNDYFDHPNIVGWTREGDGAHPDSGLAALVTNGDGGSKRMYVGMGLAGAQMTDLTGNRAEVVTVGEDGMAEFFVNGGSVSVWVKQEAARELNQKPGLQMLGGRYAVCKVDDPQKKGFSEGVMFLGKTDEEVSLICEEGRVPPGAAAIEDGWVMFRVAGRLEFGLTGILAGVADILAEWEIPIMASSTFDTDYFMVKEDQMALAKELLEKAGYVFQADANTNH